MLSNFDSSKVLSIFSKTLSTSVYKNGKAAASNFITIKMFSLPVALSLFSRFFLLSIFSFTAQAYVPSSSRFKFFNEGSLGEYIAEYGAQYRPLSIYNPPFNLFFYNTTPNAFTLALGIGGSDTILRWVWEANRGKLVRENATLTFGKDGNLVLADADGRIAWQTNTANKGVVGLELLANGNMVLHDSKGRFIWQSFDYATDTLLAGQSLRLGHTTKLVSRASDKHNINGVYSLVMEYKRLAMYYASPKSPKPFIYFLFESLSYIKKGPLEFVKFGCHADLYSGGASSLYLEYRVANSSTGGAMELARPNYNTTITFLRLDMDGNIRFYTFNKEFTGGSWEVTFTLFSRDSMESECQLPERCNKFGLCKDNQCVACPLKQGLMGWSEECEPAKPPSCRSKHFSYYKVEGVDHFMSKYSNGVGPMKEGDCWKKCTVDCKCLGYFYHKETSRCWIAYDLKTLTKVANSTHLGFIKVPT